MHSCRPGALRSTTRRPAKLDKHCRLCRAQQRTEGSQNGSAAVLREVQQDGLIFGPGQAGAWDEAGVGSPVVRCYLGDNEQRWYMWYSGRGREAPSLDPVAPASGSAGVAISSDGVNWTRGHGPVAGARGEDKAGDVGMVLAPNGDWWTHDTCHLTVSDVQVMSNSAKDTGAVYWMYYSGGSFEPAAAPAGIPGLRPGTEVEGLRMRPGLAMSQDARNWARIEGDHHSGALFDTGEEGDWDELFIASPQVINAGPEDMRMYYHSYDARRQKYVVGLATSPDGFRWQRQGPIFAGGDDANAFDGRGAAARHVVRDSASKRYVMFYEAVADDDRRSIGLAVSRDGLRGWARLDRAVLEAAAGGDGSAWDAGGVAVQSWWRPAAVGGKIGKLCGAAAVSLHATTCHVPFMVREPDSITRPQQQQQPPEPPGLDPLPPAETPLGPFCPNVSADAVPNLRPIRQWPPSRPPEPSQVTLATQLNMDRLDMLRNQCILWAGPLAVVVYAPIWRGRLLSLENQALNNTAVEELPGQLEGFIRRAEAGGSCTLTMELVSEDLGAWMDLALYPFNALRNRALALVQTELVLLLDADFLPSLSLSAALAQPQALAELKRLADARFAVVLPAFATPDAAPDATLVTRLVGEGKPAAVAAFAAGQIVGFQLERYPKGHASTNYQRWVTAKKPYLTDYDEGYEPYLIVARKYIPWYDERFRGYGQDKVVQVLNMAGWLQFVVHPTAFVVHQPHSQGKMHNLTAALGQWDELMRLYMATRLQIFRHRYVPVSARSCNEASALPRWEAPAHQQHMVELAGEDVAAFKARHRAERRALREPRKRVTWQAKTGV
ncbi:hypothetical protein WJX72_009116 [[Myrmecia] bisecta]|uniref:Glycosyltransferase n=1 Tax=[Myrmecia] bisecta TaxID=41462 RepID=A0AAW1P666_9CHLO